MLSADVFITKQNLVIHSNSNFSKEAKCANDKPLAIACSSDYNGLDLRPILLDLNPPEQLFRPSWGQGLAAIKTGQSQIYTPFCKSDQKGFDDKEARGLCKSLGFPCGMEARQHQLNISSTFDNLGYVSKPLDGRSPLLSFFLLPKMCQVQISRLWEIIEWNAPRT